MSKNMSKNIYDIVGERVREERKKAGLTIERLAELAQISFPQRRKTPAPEIKNDGRS